MDGSGMCKLPFTPPSTGLSRIQHLNMAIINFDIKTSADNTYICPPKQTNN